MKWLSKTNENEKENQNKNMPPPGIAPGLPAPQAGVLLLYYSGGGCGGSGYRSRFSTLRRLYATMYNNPPCASIGTRTRILSLEGINTTLVLWTHGVCGRRLLGLGDRCGWGDKMKKRTALDISRIRTDEGIAH